MNSDSDDWYSPNLSSIPPDLEKNPIEENPAAEQPINPLYPDIVITNCSLNTYPFFVIFNPDHNVLDTYEVLALTCCFVYFLYGVVCTFFGYRCFKAVMFFTGFIFASILVYLICRQETPHLLPHWASILVAISAGILFGLISLLVQYVGLFMLGFHAGLLLIMAGLCLGAVLTSPLQSLIVGFPNLTSRSPWSSVLLLILMGTIMALLNLKFKKSLTKFSSALYGGSVIVATLDYIVEHATILIWVWERISVKKSGQPCWFSWTLLASWPILVILGFLCQVFLTAKGTYHEEMFPSRSQRNRRNNKPESREERKQRKYRYLYQVRTCHGDVISQPIPRKYVQQVNESTYEA